MKIYSYIKYLLIGSLFFTLQSCDDNFADLKEKSLTWQESTHLKINAVEGKENFIWEKSVETSLQYWKNTSIELDVVINSKKARTELSKIDFYITAEERDGYNYSAPFDTNGKLLRTISAIPEDGKLSLALNAEEVYQMFSSDFKNDRTVSKVLSGDLFELHWVITAKDGSVMDSRNYVGGEYRYDFSGLYLELSPVWPNTFKVEWLAGKDLLEMIGASFASDEITITATTASGTYDAPYLFNANIGMPFMASLVFNSDTGETQVADVWGLGAGWKFSNIDGVSLDIELTGTENILMPGAYKVRLTRTDGANWPTNIH
ncbi:hypothetical protein DWB61_12690 [Ancylomarina euxinus]|uniref:Uncharacterized protein n=1 Tax=Ancylomarina euxinus TaxID=2283627 RepID=A0A425XZ51_9BACT|nr:hypothetical protein [Ancylomarina euxinus]MCZ4695575.1 hypothetical protein [Ancylomarina euxinus]MUP15956.1 hypothetical protein [Ancylomarina euxinus]RRG20397.1 hypothetical protein DWB61_12690 [Ancylomarina euxinus]